MATSAERVKEIRRKKRDDAYCVELGCKTLSGKDARCEVHADAHAARMRKKRGKAA